MFVRTLPLVLRAAFLPVLALLALIPVACSQKEQPPAAASASANSPAGAATSAAPALNSRERRRQGRVVRTKATIETLDSTAVSFKLADGSILKVERNKLTLPDKARRTGGSPAKAAFPALAVGQKHVLMVRYGEGDVPLEVRVRRPDRDDDRDRDAKR